MGVLAVTADVTDDVQVERMTAAAADGLGGLDVLVNNAGVCFHNASFDVTDSEWDQVFDTNVRALWKCSRAAARPHGAGRWGLDRQHRLHLRFDRNRPQWQAPYNASKAAVHQLTKSLAAEWAPSGIRVNAVAPGYVKTEMAPVDRPELRRFWIEDAPQQRYAQPEEIAPSVVCFASDASAFMTGSVLVIDGGYTVW